MLDRAIVIDNNFLERVRDGNLPAAKTSITPREAGLAPEAFLDLFNSQMMSRHLDLIARVLKQQGRGFYTIGSSGHEGNAAIAKALRVSDMALLHYRSSAFVIQRAKDQGEKDYLYHQLLSLVASADDPIAGGRHKVFGSLSLNIPPQTSTIASHLPKAVGLALSITRAKELKIPSQLLPDSVVLCSFGDASVHHSTAQGALNAIQWIAFNHYPLPLILVCEDNHIGISVGTPPDWIETIIKPRKGIDYMACDGLNLADVYRVALNAAHRARVYKRPVFLHLSTVRLLGHGGSDIEQHYHSEAQIQAQEADDPLLHSARIALEQGLLTQEKIIAQYQQIRSTVAKEAERALTRPQLGSAKAVLSALIPNARPMTSYPPVMVTEAKRRQTFGDAYEQLSQPRNMCQLINFALTDLMVAYPNIVVFGEDVGKKGGVYRVTANLQARFGQRRVFDTLLDEQTILGHAIGFAMNGFLPIPEMQFLAYYHNAEDQIRGEAGSLSFFSRGQYTNPMVLRIPGLGYQKGFGGHFHNDNSIAALRDVPGLIIACPSNGLDAVKMLRTCHTLSQYERRVVIFLEPIALYMTKDLHENGDNAWLHHYPLQAETIELGEIGIYGEGEAVVIITYANGYYLARQAEEILRSQYQQKIKIIDLRWLLPLPKTAILKAIEGAKHVVIMDEGRHTASLGEEIVTALVEGLAHLPKITRVTGLDTYIPLGNAWQYVLPSREDIVAAVLNQKTENRRQKTEKK